ncbi:MAG: Asp23/Gls24 family envelope stress response protein [Rubrobacter sp.]|nr:Asp23/Gls24 family envelope stress response protein [Rubrobacter sp.]
MSESEGQRSESPLLSERGATIISGTVVSSIAGMAAQEVEGVHMGGGGSRTASGVLGSITGSESNTSGISVDVGRTEAAIDLKMGIEYNKNILQTVEEVRRRITDRVESMTGLRIKELNATITDITFPEKEQRRRLISRSATTEREDSPTEETSTASETQTIPESEETSEPETAETTEVEPTSRAHTEGTSGPVPEEEVSVEGRPLEEDEIAEVRSGNESTEERPTDEAPEADTRAESEPSEVAETRADDETSETPETGTSEQDDAEARMRRRAEERARRRRRSQDS